MNQGDCFFNKATKIVRSHPWVIVSDPNEDSGNVVILNLTDADDWEDKTCVLEPADHPGWLTKNSCVAFSEAKVTSVADLEAAHKAGLIFNKSQMPDAAFDKILQGAQVSEELKNAPKLVLIRQGIVS